MAEVSYLHFDDDDDDDDDCRDYVDDDVVVTLDSVPYWSRHDFGDDDVYASSDLDFPPFHRISTVHHHQSFEDDVESITNIEDDVPHPFFDSVEIDNDANFVTDLELGFQHGVELSSSSTSSSRRVIVESEDLGPLDPNSSVVGVIDGNDEINPHDLGLEDPDLELGFSMDGDEHNNDYDDGNNSGFMVADCGDEFFVARRGAAALSESGESSADGPVYFMSGLRSVDISSGSEEARETEGLRIDLNGDEDEDDDFRLDRCDEDDVSVPSCWDSFHLEDEVEVNHVVAMDGNEEWEEVDGGVGEREVLSMFFDAEDEGIPSAEELRDGDNGGEMVFQMGTLEWEVLLNIHNLEGSPELGHNGEHHFSDHDAEYEMMFGQFFENEGDLVGRPPASKLVVENLQSVVVTQEDVNNDALCAVCKDEVNVGGSAKQLPCTHRYHGNCIVPWLGIRNTCPVCRYELPTDDLDYERRRTQRTTGRAH